MAFHQRLEDELFGKEPVLDEHGNVLDPGVPARQYDATFRQRYRMGRHLVMKIYVKGMASDFPHVVDGEERIGAYFLANGIHVEYSAI